MSAVAAGWLITAFKSCVIRDWERTVCVKALERAAPIQLRDFRDKFLLLEMS